MTNATTIIQQQSRRDSYATCGSTTNNQRRHLAMAETFSCYIVGDRTSMVFEEVIRHGGKVLQGHGWRSFSQTRSIVARRLHSSLVEDKPTVLWIHLDSAQAFAQSVMHNIRVVNLSPLIAEQERSGRMVVLEGSWSEVNWTTVSRQLMGIDS